MAAEDKELLKVLDDIQGVPVLVVGDIILDRYVWGSVDRISPEAPVPVVNVQRTEDRLGGAGNAVLNLRKIGADVTLCGVIGDDQEGKEVLQLLEEEGVHRDGVMIDRHRPTSVKTRVIAHSQQVVRIDREDVSEQGVALREGLAALVVDKLSDSRVVVLSDYGKGTIGSSVFDKLAEAHSKKLIGLNAVPLVVDPHPVNYGLYSGITIAKPNRKEAEIAAGIKIVDKATALEAAHRLRKKWDAELMMITLGEDGLIIVRSEDDEGVFLETVALEVFDVSGAGDTVTAIVAAALGVGTDPAVAGELANIAAGIVVSEIGTVPIELNRLQEAIKQGVRG